MFNEFRNMMVSKEAEDNVLIELRSGKREILERHDWPYICFNTRFRANALCWIKAEPGQSFLQIGSDYGCLAEFFLKKGCLYDCVELSKQSLFINKQRNSSVRMIDFDSIDKKYDFIVLYEALYYAKDAEKLMKLVEGYLKERGHIYILEHNRNSYLYLSGKRNEHSGRSFDDNTFLYTKKELDELIKGKEYRFYYPHPNFEFCMELFTDRTVNSLKTCSLDNSLECREVEAFSIPSFCSDMRESSLMQYFMDGFVIEISDSLKNIDYIKVWSNRSREMSIITELDYDRGKVYKYPYDMEAERHLRKMDKRVCSYGKMKEIDYLWTEGHLECDILNLPCLSDLYHEADDDGKKLLLDDYRSCILSASGKSSAYTVDFENVFGPEKAVEDLNWLENGNVDLSFDNIFVKGDSWLIIDAEWNLGIPVPAEYIMYRAFSFLGLDKSVVGVSDETLKVFEKWERHLCYRYQGTEELCLHKRFKLTQESVDDLLVYESFYGYSKKLVWFFDRIMKKITGILGR